MNTLIQKTYEAITEFTLSESIIAIIKNQYLMILFLFVLLPLVILMFTIMGIYDTKSLKKGEVRDKLIINYLVTMIISILTYVFMMAYDWRIIDMIKDFFSGVA